MRENQKKIQREFVKTKFFLRDFVKWPIFNRIFTKSWSLVNSSPILNRSASHKTLQRLTEPHITTLTSNYHFRVYLLLCFSHPYLEAKTSQTFVRNVNRWPLLAQREAFCFGSFVILVGVIFARVLGSRFVDSTPDRFCFPSDAGNPWFASSELPRS